MINLVNMAMSDFYSAAPTGSWGYTKDKEGKKQVVEQAPAEQPYNRWGLWAGFNAYSDGRNLYEADFGIDYRLDRHWLIGADARIGWLNRGHGATGPSLTQGGIYTAFYERGWYGVAGGLLGPNQGTVYGATGYDFHFDNWIVGPAVNVQWDDDTVDQGFGRGQLFQARAGGRIAYVGYSVIPWLQVMYQNDSLDVFPHRQNAVWAGAGLAIPINQHWSIYGGYSIEANDRYQINQANLAVRFGF